MELTATQKIYQGMTIILSHDPAAQLATGHDVVFMGEYKPDDMTEDDLRKMWELGWFECEDSWAHYCR